MQGGLSELGLKYLGKSVDIILLENNYPDDPENIASVMLATRNLLQLSNTNFGRIGRCPI